MVNKGWFEVPGMVSGQRTLEQQTRGLEALWPMVADATVLDLGCAEGLIALACAGHGAARVDALEFNPELLEVAARLDQGATVNWKRHNLNNGLPDGLLPRYDVVLALAIIHKMAYPARLVAAIAQRAAGTVVVRLPRGSRGGISSKHWPHTECDITEVMAEHGLALRSEAIGPNKEWVFYYQRGCL